MVQEFEEAAFSMEEGQISEPIKTQFGYHIIKLVSRKEAAISPLEEVKEQIQNHLIGLKTTGKNLMRQPMSLKEKYEVKIYI